jgi:hypothetical protein
VGSRARGGCLYGSTIVILYMRDKQYKGKTFKLDDITVKRLEELKVKTGKSWNLLFLDLIKEYDNNK